MSRAVKQPESVYLRYPFSELDRLDSLLKHAATGLHFVQQGLDAIREVVGTGVLYTDRSPRGRRARPKRITSVGAMLTRRERARQSEVKEAAGTDPKAPKPRQRARRRGRKAKTK
jgi:hypothetical protein